MTFDDWLHESMRHVGQLTGRQRQSIIDYTGGMDDLREAALAVGENPPIFDKFKDVAGLVERAQS